MGNKVKKVSLLLSVLLLAFAVSYVLGAWQEPTSPPPEGNVVLPQAEYVYHTKCCWTCNVGDQGGKPLSCADSCAPPACGSGDIDLGISCIHNGVDIETDIGAGGIQAKSPSSVAVGCGHCERACLGTKPVYVTSCCWTCNAGDNTGKPVSCSGDCTPSACADGYESIGTGSVASSCGIAHFVSSAASPQGPSTLATGAGYTERYCRQQ